MNDGKVDPTAAGSLIDQESSSSDVAIDAGGLFGWIFDMVRWFYCRWSDMLCVTPLAIASQADAAWLHFGGELSRQSWEALFYSLPIWGLSYIGFGLSLGIYRKDWSCSVSLNWERVILLNLFAERASRATHTMDVMSRENLPMGTAVTGCRSFCSARRI